MTFLAAAIKKMAKGQKQSEIAKRIGVSEAYLSDMLNARRRISPLMLDNLANVLTIDRVSLARLHKLGAREQGWKV